MTAVDPAARRSYVTVFLVSWAAVHLQLGLMRVLSVARWHHFSYLVISTALLGYALSGSALQVFGARLVARLPASMFWLATTASALGSLAIAAAQALPIDSQYLFTSTEQLGRFVAASALMVVPFLLIGSTSGLALMAHRRDASRLYGVGMIGTAAGGAAAIALMPVLSEERLCQSAFLAAGLAALPWLDRVAVRVLASTGALLLVGWGTIVPTPLAVEPHKGLARLERWREQGDAEAIVTRHGPRGRLDVYASPLLHSTLFAGLSARQGPPPQYALLRDGSFAGTIFRIASADQAGILDSTPASIAYRLRPGARVLLLGETGGVNVWLARRFGARRIVVVQPDANVVAILRHDVPTGVLDGPDVEVVVQEPRLYLASSRETFDVVQLVSAEEMAAESRGAAGLAEDYMLTAEGLALALDRLDSRGLLTATRGIQLPQRDVLKLASTMTAAYERRGVAAAGRQLLFARNYLANVMVAFRTPPAAADWEPIRAALDRLSLDADWPPELVRQPPFSRESAIRTTSGQQTPSTPSALASVLAPSRATFLRDWIYDIRPATDDRPYFRDFFRFRALGYMREVYGQQLLQRVELAFALLIATFAEVSLVAIFVLMVPAWAWSRRRRSVTRTPIARSLVFFFAIGVGFMAFEIDAIARAMLLIGDPVRSATLVLTILLAAAGVGSWIADRELANAGRTIRRGFLSLLVLAPLLAWLAARGATSLAAWPLGWRAAALGAGLLPLGLCLGLFFPSGLHLARRADEALVPWAWGANGFASVATPPLVTALAMSVGHRVVIALALLAYLAAMLAYGREPADERAAA